MRQLTLLLLIFLFSCSQKNTNIKTSSNKSLQTDSTTTLFNRLEIPWVNTPDSIIVHEGYCLLYNEEHEQATWVAYELTSLETNKVAERTNNFRVDPSIKTETATNNDYERSGYDRGHLAPAGDMSWSQESMSASFYYSNISPQKPGFNRGIWKKLEEQVRIWAKEEGNIFIVTGPVLSKELSSIGMNQVSVPNYFYKVILDYSDSTHKAIGFIIPNMASSKPIQEYAVTIDSVEQLTSINFFWQLGDRIENILESSIDLEMWNWNK